MTILSSVTLQVNILNSYNFFVLLKMKENTWENVSIHTDTFTAILIFPAVILNR